ncbi:MAG TPA: DUF2935 domain-containing protein [Clostridia bacterium]|nr:DUF2935 domain-containing protein [Clostridia bacterium]
MLTDSEYISQSLALHLFYSRIMKEHAIFLQSAFPDNGMHFIKQANNFMKNFEHLLRASLDLTGGVMEEDVLKSNELVTLFTLKAEQMTGMFTGIAIDTEITVQEGMMTVLKQADARRKLMKKISDLNAAATNLVTEYIQFKAMLMNNILKCVIFTYNYPLMLDHMITEAKDYLELIKLIQNKQSLPVNRDQYIKMNSILGEHAKFARGLLDPSEEALIYSANEIAVQFDTLLSQARFENDESEKALASDTYSIESMNLARSVRDFKADLADGILSCEIKGVVLPLFADHILREANHYIRTLGTANQQ